MECDNIMITTGSQTIVLKEQPFVIRVKLVEGDQHVVDEIFNGGVKGNTAENLAEYFEIIAKSIRKRIIK